MNKKVDRLRRTDEKKASHCKSRAFSSKTGTKNWANFTECVKTCCDNSSSICNNTTFSFVQEFFRNKTVFVLGGGMEGGVILRNMVRKQFPSNCGLMFQELPIVFSSFSCYSTFCTWQWMSCGPLRGPPTSRSPP